MSAEKEASMRRSRLTVRSSRSAWNCKSIKRILTDNLIVLFYCRIESEIVVHSDDAFAPVAILLLKNLVLKEKNVGLN